MIKKPAIGDTRLQFHIYDVVSDASFSERYSLLDGRNTMHPTIKIVPTDGVSQFEDLMELHQCYRAAGYEGSMLRHGNDPYQTGKRSSGLLKVKEFHDAEFVITGVRQGKPYITARGTFEVPVWECAAANGKTFTVTAQGDMYEKHVQWVSRDELIGKLLTVKYHYLSKDGIPQLPIALRFYETV